MTTTTRNSPTTPETIEAIRARRQAGETLANIGAALGVSRQRIQQLCAKHNIKCPTDLNAAPPEAVARALALLATGNHTIRAAAKEAGVGAMTVRRYAVAEGMNLAALIQERSLHQYDGRTFGSWVVVAGSYLPGEEDPNTRSVECQCSCGVVRRVRVGNLLNGYSRGCGCRQRMSTPWVCEATGERVQSTTKLAEALGATYLTLLRCCNTGRSYTDSQGQVWKADSETAVPHKRANPWICIQTRQLWPSVYALAEHLSVSSSALVYALKSGRAYAAADGNHYCPAHREPELEVRPRGNKLMVQQPWICDQTGQAWPSRGQMEKHLGLGNHGLARRSTYTAPDGLTYRRLEQAPPANQLA